METPMMMLSALGVVEYHGALRHLENLRAVKDPSVTDLTIDLISGELDRLCVEWAIARRLNTAEPGITYDEIEADARAYLTDHVDDLDALLAQRNEVPNDGTTEPEATDRPAGRGLRAVRGPAERADPV